MDMLVKLYDLPDAAQAEAGLAQRGIVVRRAMAHERERVVDWVRKVFADSARGWPAECEIAFSRMPVACQIAVAPGGVAGFACTEVTARGFLGPIGVAADSRARGVGRVLLLSALNDLRARGYAYGVIGQVGAADFFLKTVGALEIPGSSPGPYPPAPAID